MECRTDCMKDVTAEGDPIHFSCGGLGSSTVLTWYNKEDGSEVPGVSPQREVDWGLVERRFTMNAAAPEVVPHKCSAKVPNLPEIECVTESCGILCKYVY